MYTSLYIYIYVHTHTVSISASIFKSISVSIPVSIYIHHVQISANQQSYAQHIPQQNLTKNDVPNSKRTKAGRCERTSGCARTFLCGSPWAPQLGFFGAGKRHDFGRETAADDHLALYIYIYIRI